MSSRLRTPTSLPPALEQLIHAAEHHFYESSGADIRGVAGALREYGAAARWILPIHGAFVAYKNEVMVLIDRVASRHLKLEDARTEFRTAVQTVESFEQRDAIEVAHVNVLNVSDHAHFYAGVALGITMASHD